MCFSPNLFQFVLPGLKYVQDCTHNKICFFYVFKKANRLEITPVKIWNVINFKIILHQDKELWIVFVEIYFYMYMYITGRIQWKRISPLESKLFIGLGHNHRILCYSSLMIRHEVNHCITAVLLSWLKSMIDNDNLFSILLSIAHLVQLPWDRIYHQELPCY